MYARNQNVAAWVAIVNANGYQEVCPVSKTQNVYAQFSPVILRWSREGEIILEFVNKPRARPFDPDDDRKNEIVRVNIGNGVITKRDSDWNPILRCVPCASHAEAIIEAKRLMEVMMDYQAAA
ncbi:MAG: hypothetical protein NTX72_01225 [Candidatus Uhrbacteria bacterium]|nr:hypothetical protein [Candidatus Uhrbacteria bacterium]